MTPTNAQAIHFLIALSALLIAAHAGRLAFALLRQPPALGELVAGLVLGPTLLGEISPSAERWLFHGDALTPAALGGIYELGLLALVFLAGTQMRGFVFAEAERRTVVGVAVVGMVLPFACGLGIAAVAGTGSFRGPHGSTTTLVLVLGLSTAVTSVPVISRIMMDLDITATVFGRMVLAVAVAEDVVLFVVLAVVLGLAGTGQSSCCGVWAATGITSIPASAAYFAAVPVLMLLAVLAVGRPALSRLDARPRYPVYLHESFLLRLGAVLAGGLLALGLGIDPLFGALAAGMCLGPDDGAFTRTASTFFVPVYLAMVGLRLDLVRQVDWWFLCWFLAVACAAKSASVWLGARAAGTPRRLAIDLAVATNARGGPGILIASTTYAAGIVFAKLFTALILLSLVSSQAAGAWLGRAVRTGRLPTASSLRVRRAEESMARPVAAGPPVAQS